MKELCNGAGWGGNIKQSNNKGYNVVAFLLNSHWKIQKMAYCMPLIIKYFILNF